MPRYSLAPLAAESPIYEIVTGWDSELETFYVTVFAGADEAGHPEPTHWHGRTARQIVDPHHAIAIARHYAWVPDHLLTELQHDQAGRPTRVCAAPAIDPGTIGGPPYRSYPIWPDRHPEPQRRKDQP